jgi:hypothetical protein
VLRNTHGLGHFDLTVLDRRLVGSDSHRRASFLLTSDSEFLLPFSKLGMVNSPIQRWVFEASWTKRDSASPILRSATFNHHAKNAFSGRPGTLPNLGALDRFRDHELCESVLRNQSGAGANDVPRESQ